MTRKQRNKKQAAVTELDLDPSRLFFPFFPAFAAINLSLRVAFFFFFFFFLPELNFFSFTFTRTAQVARFFPGGEAREGCGRETNQRRAYEHDIYFMRRVRVPRSIFIKEI